MGLSAARESVHRMGGRIQVFSEIGRGSLFRLHLPLSVSITRALLIRADGEDYALPLSAIVESVRFRPGDGHQINHAGAYRWRGSVIPLLDLGFVFGTARDLRKQGYVVIVEAEGKHRGLIGDDLTGIKEIVVKGLDSIVGSTAGVAGSTILGDGRVVLILDPRGLVGIKPFLENEAERAALGEVG
jgi:two-component system chemotaxis sensor kinase CheA